MKKLVALILCVLSVTLAFTSCGFDPEDKGAIIAAHITSQVADVDPTKIIYDKDVIKYTSLLFEGLTVVNADGSVSGGLAKNWSTRFDEERREYYILFNLYESHWSDGRALLADHFVDAWKRILAPASDSAAACLLYDIKNAKKVKSGEMTVDDLGVAATSSYTLEVQLEQKIDIDLFLEAVASPALVPMRSDVLDDYPDDWGTSTENLLSCGYFNMGEMLPQNYTLTKASNYKISFDADANENPNTYVKPRELFVDYTLSNVGRWNAYLADELYYMEVNEIPQGAEDYASEIRTKDLLCTYTCFFNNEHETLKDADVRRALSLSIDREHIASLAGLGASAATGFVANGVFDAGLGSSFRKTGGDLLAVTADAAAAKELLRGKDISETISLSFQREEQAIAQYLKETWEALGLTVKLNGVSESTYKNVLNAQKFDVLLIDYQGLSTTAYSFLMPFATAYSGNTIEVDGAYTSPHMTRFSDAEYDALAERVSQATNSVERTALLHELEALFLARMPAAPLCFWSTPYVVSGELSHITFNGFGVCTFKDATLKNYQAKNEAWLEAQAAAQAQ